MLFHFRVPRTRPWDKYIKKLSDFLSKDDATSHLVDLLTNAQELRAPLVKLLDECAKENTVRSDELIKILNAYLPALELLYEGFKACNIKLNGYLDIVWTSFMTMNVNKKSLSYDISWEKAMAYTVLGLAHYCKAQELHHDNRGQAKKKKDEDNAKEDEYDPVFDDLPQNKGPQIYDDTNVIKSISINLKKSGAIWHFISKNCYPVNIVSNQYDSIPESFRDVLMCLSNIALVNAQEFMVQLCVQTNKSKSLTSKLSMGVSKKLKESNNLIKNNLGKHYQDIRLDFKLYLTIRSRLYLSISNKYMAQECKKNETYGQEVAYYKVAYNILNKTSGFPDSKDKFTITMNVMQKSIKQQLNAVKLLLKDAESDNNNIYYDVVPKTVDQPTSKWAIKVDTFQPITE